MQFSNANGKYTLEELISKGGNVFMLSGKSSTNAGYISIRSGESVFGKSGEISISSGLSYRSESNQPSFFCA